MSRIKQRRGGGFFLYAALLAVIALILPTSPAMASDEEPVPYLLTARVDCVDGAPFLYVDASGFSEVTSGSEYNTFATYVDGELLEDYSGDFSTYFVVQTFIGVPMTSYDWRVEVTDHLNPEEGNQVIEGTSDLCNDDWDEDGVLNYEDECPDTPVGDEVDSVGCSSSQLEDTDGDQVLNYEDECPDVAGPASNNGCPIDPQQSNPTVSVEVQGCVVPGTTMNVSGTIFNVQDGTDEVTKYTWEVAPHGGGSVVDSGTTEDIIDGQSTAFNIRNVPVGTFVVSVTGADETVASSTFDVKECVVIPPTEVVPSPVTFSDKDGAANDRYSVPATAGVDYVINGATKPAGSYSGSGRVTAVAVARAGFVLKSGATSQWGFTFSDVAIGTPAVYAPKASVKVNCRGKGKIVLSNVKSTQTVKFKVSLKKKTKVYRVAAGKKKTIKFAGAKPKSKIIVRDASTGRKLAGAKVAVRCR